MRATLLSLGLSLTACGPAILHRRSPAQARGVCAVETLAYDNPHGTGPRRIVAEYDAAGRMVFHRFQPQYHSEVAVSFRRDISGRLRAMDFAYHRDAERGLCDVEGGCSVPALSLVGRVELAYDPAGRLTEVVDQRDPGPTRVTSFVYDAQGRLVEGRWGGHVSRYEYAQGPLVARDRWENSDGGHGTYAYTWDARGNLTETTLTMCLRVCGAPSVSRYEYDARGLLVRGVSYDGSTQHWAYDEQGRLVSHGGSHSAEARYEYDAQGRLARMRLGDRVQQEYSYRGECAPGVNAPEAAAVPGDPRERGREGSYEPTVF